MIIQTDILHLILLHLHLVLHLIHNYSPYIYIAHKCCFVSVYILFYFCISVVDARFMNDETYPDNICVIPGVKLIKKWLVRNTGQLAWGSNISVSCLVQNSSFLIHWLFKLVHVIFLWDIITLSHGLTSISFAFRMNSLKLLSDV